MTLFLEYLVVGLVEGFIIATLAFAIVFLVKSTGFVNFAQGAMSTLAAFVVYELYLRLHNTAEALVLGLLITVAFSAGFFLLVIRPRASEDHLNMLMRTVGIYLLIEAFINLVWSVGQPFSLPQIFPATSAFELAGVVVSWNSVWTVLVTIALMALFVGFFKFTNLGLLFVGFADNAAVARLLGTRIRLLGLVAWMIAGILGIVVGVLIEPSTFLTTTMTDPILLFAFAAAVIGGLNSLTGAVIGGVVMGLADVLLTAYTGSNSATVYVFLFVLVMLQIWPNGIFGQSSVERL